VISYICILAHVGRSVPEGPFCLHVEDGKFVLNVLAVDSSATLVSIYQTTRHHIPEDCFFKEEGGKKRNKRKTRLAM